MVGLAVGLSVLLVVLTATALTLARRLVRVVPVGDGYPLRVVTVNPAATRVTLTRGPDAAEPGTFRLSWPGGQARVGPVLAEDATTVTRSLTPVSGHLGVGQPVGIQANPFTGDPRTALGRPFDNIAIAGPTGALPAWFLPGSRPTWVLLIHGLDGSRADTLPAMPILSALGFPMLAISYRNDVGAAPSADHHGHLGDTEWHDVEAAITYATTHGAQGVVLYGWSLGGGMAVVTSEQSPVRDRVRALVLDSPLLDWPATLRATASLQHVPAPLLGATEMMLRAQFGVSLGRYQESRLAAGLATPTLLIQGSADRVVPPAIAATFARGRPDLVAYLPVMGADHVSAINTDPGGYSAALIRLLGPLR